MHNLFFGYHKQNYQLFEYFSKKSFEARVIGELRSLEIIRFFFIHLFIWIRSKHSGLPVPDISFRPKLNCLSPCLDIMLSWVGQHAISDSLGFFLSRE